MLMSSIPSKTGYINFSVFTFYSKTPMNRFVFFFSTYKIFSSFGDKVNTYVIILFSYFLRRLISPKITIMESFYPYIWESRVFRYSAITFTFFHIVPFVVPPKGRVNYWVLIKFWESLIVGFNAPEFCDTFPTR